MPIFKRSKSKAATKAKPTTSTKSKTTKRSTPKSTGRLKAVPTVEHYTVWDGTHGGKTFKTLNEANRYCNEIMRKSGEVVSVTTTTKQVTHTYIN